MDDADDHLDAVGHHRLHEEAVERQPGACDRGFDLERRAANGIGSFEIQPDAAGVALLQQVDHHDHEALVAIDPATGEGIGIARYIRSRVDDHVAELAIAVADNWQRSGVGSRLAAALAERAREEEITAFTASLFTDNTLMLSVIRHLGVVHDVHSEQGVTELTVDLYQHGLGRSPTFCAPPPEAEDINPRLRVTRSDSAA